jgi:hypothetical protein
MNDILISLDPSFTRTGICIVNLKTKEIYFETASCKIGEKQFVNVVKAAQSIVSQLVSIFSKYGNNFDLISEEPLPVSSMSSALYALDTLIYNTFENHIIKTYNPSTLCSKIHGHKYDKRDSQELTEKYLNKLTSCGYTIKSIFGTKKKLPHDCAEALLYLHLFLHDSGHCDFQFDNSEEIKAYKLRKKELKKKEKELLKQDPTYLS